MNHRYKWATLTGLLGTALLQSSSAFGDALADQKVLYDKNCKKCHAEDGTGKKNGEWLAVIKTLKIEAHPEGLNLLSEEALKLEKKDIVAVISDGKEDKEKGKMKGFKDKLSADEIQSIADYVIHLRTKAK